MIKKIKIVTLLGSLQITSQFLHQHYPQLFLCLEEIKPDWHDTITLDYSISLGMDAIARLPQPDKDTVVVVIRDEANDAFNFHNDRLIMTCLEKGFMLITLYESSTQFGIDCHFQIFWNVFLEAARANTKNILYVLSIPFNTEVIRTTVMYEINDAITKTKNTTAWQDLLKCKPELLLPYLAHYFEKRINLDSRFITDEVKAAWVIFFEEYTCNHNIEHILKPGLTTFTAWFEWLNEAATVQV